jgi:hypothetical protein
MRYFQEIAPYVALDRAEIISLNETVETPAGTFSGALKIRDGTALNNRVTEVKTYAPGIGLLQDEALLLIEHGFVDAADG